MTRSRRHPQRGFALLALVALAVLALGWTMLTTFAGGGRVAAERAHDSEALAQAKQALIAWAAMKALDAQEDNPGRLPCPEAAGYVGDPNQEGIAAAVCALPKVGRLPWRTLGLPKLIDSAGEPLWYVLSPGWGKASSTGKLQINSDSVGRLALDGNANHAVALVIAPGPALAVAASANCAPRIQSRAAMPPDYRDYLECDNATSPADASFASEGPADSFNDQVVAVTAADVLPGIEAAIAKRIERDIAPELAKAAQAMPGAAGNPAKRFYPYAAAWGDPLASAYRGAARNWQGLLPLARARKVCVPSDWDCDATLASKPCTPGSDAQCDPSSAVSWRIGQSIAERGAPDENGQEWTVRWDDGSQLTLAIAPGGPSAAQARIGDVDCGASSPSMVWCTVAYGQTCPKNLCLSDTPVDLYVTARTGDNAGLVFRRVNTALLPASATANIALQGDASAIVVTDWKLPPVPAWCSTVDCLHASIAIPALLIEDNVDLQARLRDAPPKSGPPTTDLSWFLRNGWHRLAYFAFAPSLAPGGSGACSGSTPPDACLQIANLAPANKQRAILVMAGRSLSGQARPSARLADFLDSDENRDADAAFEQLPAGRTSNDRIVALDRIP